METRRQRNEPGVVRRGDPARCLLALAVAAGAVDAASYLGLGRVFTANMTGNTVLLGVALARGTGADAARAATALGGFCVGAAAGVGMAKTAGRWPGRATPAFGLESVALAALLVLWSTVGVKPARVWLIAISGLAMGAQSAAARSSQVQGVNTTYMTGTLLNAIARVVLRARGLHERPQSPALPGAAWGTYALGAVAGALTEAAWRPGAIAMALAIVAGVAGRAVLDTREEG